MNKQAALERLTALENEAAALRKVIEQPENKGLWRPEPDGKYYYVSADGLAGSAHRDRKDWYSKTINHGNCFPSSEAAQKAAPLMSRANKIIAAALQVDPDAGEWRRNRRHCALIVDDKWVVCVVSAPHVSDTRLVHVHTSEQAQSMADILNAEGVQ
jgi:hypothetical protein